MATQNMQPLTANPPRTPPPRSSGGLMGWFFFLSSLFWPRFVLFTFWLFGNAVADAFDGWVVPVLGFIFLPWTTMTYTFTWVVTAHSASGAQWIFLGLGLLFDLWTWGGGRRLLFGE